MRRRIEISLALVSLALALIGYAFPPEDYPGVRPWAVSLAGICALTAIAVFVWPQRTKPDPRQVAVERIAVQRERGLELRSRLIALGDHAKARPLYDTWYDETLKVLQHRAPDYVAEFQGGSWPAAEFLGITDPELNSLILRLDWRLGRLGVIIGYLSAQSSKPAISESDQT